MLHTEQHTRCLDLYDFSKNCLDNRSLASGLANNLYGDDSEAMHENRSES